jgi:hypothetical protein
MSVIEFLVHDVRFEGGAAFVSGIVNKGAVATGSAFTLVRTESAETSPVNLSVEAIVAYRRTIDELPTGMSGELKLVGEGSATLKKHDMLEI